MKQAVLSLSGGMDSSTLLLRLLREGYTVTALSFNYGQKHSVELEKAKDLVNYLNMNLSHTQITHQVIDLSTLTPLLESNLVTGGEEVPEGHYENENMKLTVVPNRNKIFSSIIQAVALSISMRTEKEVKIAMGIHAGDHAIYPDCRQGFRDADYHAFLLGNWDAEKVILSTPYLEYDKYDILLDGEISCQKLGIDFDEVYSRTMTSYKPICIKSSPLSSQKEDMPKELQGEIELWYSDYKSASSVERVEAFIRLDRVDPVKYADKSGPVSWEKVVEEVMKILNHEA